MAINYTISFTFSPSTTISSSQVNTNTSDNANTWNGLELGTKTIAQIKIDADPTTALQVPTKQYVDHYSTYRRPVLQYSSGTVVNMETGINGTSGQAQILFPDGTIRTDSTTGRINCNFAQVAALSGTAQSGLRTGTVSNNTWYAIYAVKTTDNTSNFVAVADTVLPVQGSFSTLNSNFGTSGWVYLGLVRNGDNGSTATGILKFAQSGNFTTFRNKVTGVNVQAMDGILFATTASATNLTYTYASGTGAAQIPSIISNGRFCWATAAIATATISYTADNTHVIGRSTVSTGTQQFVFSSIIYVGDGVAIDTSGAVAMDIMLGAFWDGVLGVGSNPIL